MILGELLSSNMQSLSGDKSFVRKLIGSLKEAVRAGESKLRCADKSIANALFVFLQQLTATPSPLLPTIW